MFRYKNFVKKKQLVIKESDTNEILHTAIKMYFKHNVTLSLCIVM